jgi:arsenical pump membrane protein
MAAFISISAVAIVLMFLSIIFLPQVKIGRFDLPVFWIPPFLAAVILMAAGILDNQALCTDLTSSADINPFFILVLFFSMTLISIVLDETGFFRYLAEKAAEKSKGSQFRLFLILYGLISFLTVFTSNDIIILTFTPFLLTFAKRGKINPVPYLVEEFVAANTWSIAMLIGNPTNIYLGTFFSIDFLSYFQVMWVPSLFAGLASLSVMLILFAKELKQPLQPFTGETTSVDLPLMLPSLLLLAICIIVMAVSNFLHFRMWIISASSAGLLILYYFGFGFADHKSWACLKNGLKRLPYQLIPFILSMFVISLGMKQYGVAETFAKTLGTADPIYRYGLTSYLMCNVINNIPMSVFYADIASLAEQSIQLKAVYASIIGSNIGAFLSPIGALAGIMWMSIIKDYKVDFSFGKFTLYGAVISIPTICASLAGLLFTL